jgi:hypothetical protein
MDARDGGFDQSLMNASRSALTVRSRYFLRCVTVLIGGYFPKSLHSNCRRVSLPYLRSVSECVVRLESERTQQIRGAIRLIVELAIGDDLAGRAIM